MKLYKIDNLDGIGERTISVPTDSNFLFGIKPTIELSNVTMQKNGMEMSALTEPINGYTAFEETTGERPYSQNYTVTLQGTKTIEVPLMGRAFTGLFNSNGILVDFAFPIDDLAYWDPVNHPTSVTGIGSRLYNPTSGWETDTGVPTLNFYSVSAGKSVIYKLNFGGYSVRLMFLLQFLDIEHQTFIPFPDGFVPGWDNADQTIVIQGLNNNLSYPYQGEKQVGTQEAEVPVYRYLPVRLNCFESSIGYSDFRE